MRQDSEVQNKASLTFLRLQLPDWIGWTRVGVKWREVDFHCSGLKWNEVKWTFRAPFEALTESTTYKPHNFPHPVQ